MKLVYLVETIESNSNFSYKSDFIVNDFNNITELYVSYSNWKSYRYIITIQ